MQLGIFSLLTLIFVVLKLCKVIAWSWWLVFIPTFIGIAIWIVAAIIALIVVLRN